MAWLFHRSELNGLLLFVSGLDTRICEGVFFGASRLLF